MTPPTRPPGQLPHPDLKRPDLKRPDLMRPELTRAGSPRAGSSRSRAARSAGSQEQPAPRRRGRGSSLRPWPPGPPVSPDGQEHRRQQLRRASFLALGLVPLCLLLWLLLASPLLSAQHVEVTGSARVAPATVLAAAGVREGTPLARVDTEEVRARVRALAPIGRVRVVRAWPRTVRIQVTERTPVARVAQPDGSEVLVDALGVRFVLPGDPLTALPELQVPPDRSADPALQVLVELPPALRDQVVTVTLPSPSSVVLGLRDGRSVVWGPPGQADRKSAVVTALLARPGSIIDVTSPEVAVVR